MIRYLLLLFPLVTFGQGVRVDDPRFALNGGKISMDTATYARQVGYRLTERATIRYLFAERNDLKAENAKLQEKSDKQSRESEKRAKEARQFEAGLGDCEIKVMNLTGKLESEKGWAKVGKVGTFVVVVGGVVVAVVVVKETLSR